MSEQATSAEASDARTTEVIFLGLMDVLNPKNNKLNWLLLAIPVTLYFEFSHDLQMAFVFSMVAIAPLAFLMGKATEKLHCVRGKPSADC